jgi:hypothetical protein
MSTPERRITDGGRELREHLTAIGVSVPDFCEKHSIDRIHVQRVLNGERWQRITVDFAHAIEAATGGRVKWLSFLSATASKPKASKTSRAA